MESKTVFIFVSLLPFLFGVFIIIAAIKNWGKGMTPKKMLYRVIRELIGEKGTRVFGGIVGVGLILYGLFIFSSMYLDYNPFSQKNRLTDKITLEKKITQEGGTTISSSLFGTVSEIQTDISAKGDSELGKFTKISFKNNYRDNIPKIVWKMKNLEIIDLTNNNIKRLPIEEIKKLKKLKQIIVTGNNIDTDNIDSLSNQLKLEIKY